jgi:hypothetical protein
MPVNLTTRSIPEISHLPAAERRRLIEHCEPKIWGRWQELLEDALCVACAMGGGIIGAILGGRACAAGGWQVLLIGIFGGFTIAAIPVGLVGLVILRMLKVKMLLPHLQAELQARRADLKRDGGGAEGSNPAGPAGVAEGKT